MCRLTLAWVTSENSTKQLECRHLLTRSSSLDPIFSAGLTAPVRCWLPLSVVPRQLPVSSFLQPTLFRVPLPLPDTARFQVQKSFVWFRAKTDKGIVCLAGHLYSVTFCRLLKRENTQNDKFLLFYALQVFHTNYHWGSFTGVWRQQASSVFLDSSLYSNRSQHSCDLDDLYSSSDFQLLQPFFRRLW